jgi:glycine hydroxymethyltransferase
LTELGFDLVSGGTDNHLILVDLRGLGLGGKPVAQALDRARLTTNYNAVPNDPRPPLDPSGLRLGTAAVTTRGLAPADMAQVAEWIHRVVGAVRDERPGAIDAVGAEVFRLAREMPVPGVASSNAA